jgi:hypothetical protein
MKEEDIYVPPMSSAPLLDDSIAASTANAFWCWRENSPDQMDRHPSHMIVGDPADGLVQFEQYESDSLEQAFQSGLTSVSADGLTVNFVEMKMMGSEQEWQVQRVLEAATMAVIQPQSDSDTTPYLTTPTTAHAVLVQDITNDKSDIRSDVERGSNSEVRWCWRETKSQMGKHSSTEIFGDPKECWIAYDDYSNSTLEEAFCVYGGEGTCSPSSGYVVDFTTMTQKKTATGYVREVKRLANDASSSTSTNPNVIWCWEETPSQMSSHSVDQIVGNPSDCWIRYNEAAIDALESAYQAQGRRGDCTPTPGYKVSFESMTQTKNATGFQRNVKRLCKNEISRSITNPNKIWCWEETPLHMDNHSADQIVGDPSDCWIRYNQTAIDALEAAYQAQGRRGYCTPMPGYMVNFDFMTQTKNATGFQRKVRRLEESEVETESFLSLLVYDQGVKMTVQKCPYCSADIKFPVTMTTPFTYCCGCRRASAQGTQYTHDNYSISWPWRTCPYCGFYSEVKDFERFVTFYSGGGDAPKVLDRVERWSVPSCCRRCAKKALYPGIFSFLAPSRLGLKGLPAYDISHANGIVKKWLSTKKIGIRGQKMIMEAEEIYETQLKLGKYSPDLHYSLYRARVLRGDFAGAGYAIDAVLQECGNYQPAIGALERLMEQYLKEDDDSVVQVLDGKYQLLMRNCLGRTLSPQSFLAGLRKKVEVTYQRKNDCVIL